MPRTLRVKVPKGQALEEKDIPNPLATYRFPQEVLDGKYGACDRENRTQIYRCPSPQSYPGSANKLLAGRPYKRWMVGTLPRPGKETRLTTPSTTPSRIPRALQTLLQLVMAASAWSRSIMPFIGTVLVVASFSLPISRPLTLSCESWHDQHIHHSLRLTILLACFTTPTWTVFGRTGRRYGLNIPYSTLLTLAERASQVPKEPASDQTRLFTLFSEQRGSTIQRDLLRKSRTSATRILASSGGKSPPSR